MRAGKTRRLFHPQNPPGPWFTFGSRIPTTRNGLPSTRTVSPGFRRPSSTSAPATTTRRICVYSSFVNRRPFAAVSREMPNESGSTPMMSGLKSSVPKVAGASRMPYDALTSMSGSSALSASETWSGARRRSASGLSLRTCQSFWTVMTSSPAAWAELAWSWASPTDRKLARTTRDATPTTIPDTVRRNRIFWLRNMCSADRKCCHIAYLRSASMMSRRAARHAGTAPNTRPITLVVNSESATPATEYVPSHDS